MVMVVVVIEIVAVILFFVIIIINIYYAYRELCAMVSYIIHLILKIFFFS